MKIRDEGPLEDGVWGRDSLDDLRSPEELETAEDKVSRPTQWGLFHTDTFKALSVTRKALPPGVYVITRDNNDGQPIFFRKQVRGDSSFVVTDGLHAEIMREVREFWNKGRVFREHGFLHSRGYLLYGAQGVGKSSIVQQIVEDVVKNGGVVFICGKPDFFSLGLKVFRQAEPQRPLVCIFEDIDAIIRKYGEDELLSILDGANQVDRVLNIATTNYPESLDRRLISRPRRFDRVYKILGPSEKTRRDYFKIKLPKISKKELERWVSRTSGLSFAALAEAVISVKCLENEFEETLKILKDMENGHPSSSDFGKGIGFGGDDDEGPVTQTSPTPQRAGV